MPPCDQRRVADATGSHPLWAFARSKSSVSTLCSPDNSHFRFELWRPGAGSSRRPSDVPHYYWLWWFFHQTHVFANQHYGVVLVYDEQTLIHRMGVFPRFFRFPFMGSRDLQLGDLWTHPAYRNRGIAKDAIRYVLSSDACENVSLYWYIVSKENEASIRVAEDTGFDLMGEVCLKSRVGTAALGNYAMAPYETGKYL